MSLKLKQDLIGEDSANTLSGRYMNTDTPSEVFDLGELSPPPPPPPPLPQPVPLSLIGLILGP